jgi:hypothetical protein
MSGWASTPRELAVISRGAGLVQAFQRTASMPS